MTPEQKRVYDSVQSGLTIRQAADTLAISYEAAKSRYKRAKKWIEADPAFKSAATAAGSSMLPHSFWKKDGQYSVYYKVPQDESSGDLIERVAEAFQDIPAYEPASVTITHSDILSAYCLFDAHIGMRAWGKETGSDDYDLNLAERDIKSAFARLSARAVEGGEAVLIVGGDTLHSDSNENVTPASKHPLDVDGRQRLVVEVAIRSIAWAIEHLATRHEKVTVKVHRGNHDVVSHLILAFALKERYRDTSRIIVDMGETDWFWKQWGKVALFTTHGDRGSPERFIGKMADICPFWSAAPHRIAISGHIHKMQSSRIHGAMWHSVDAFCPADEYGSQFSGRRGLAMMQLDKEHGNIGMLFERIWRE